jgi:hypothetical protein
MANDLDAGASWERVAAELRACREAQQRAWGNIDNATLGRYLAGELGGEERRQVEQALEALPELRRLTDLVRDVLADCGPAVAPERTLTPAPEPAVRPAPQSALLRFWRRSGSLVSLATAACLLLALGLSMPRLGDAPAAGTAPAPSLDGGLAMRGGAPVFFTAMRPAGPPLPREAAAREDDLARIEQMDRAVVSLEKKGQRKEALVLARQYQEVARKARLEHHPRFAYSLNRVGQLYLEEGDLTAAEPSLQQALAISKQEFGPEHPATVWARNRLAGVYQVALNTPPADRTAVRSVNPGAVTFSGALPTPAAPPAPAVMPKRAEGTPYPAAGAAPNPHSNPYANPYPAGFPPSAAAGAAVNVYHDPRLVSAQNDQKSAAQAVMTARALRERITRLDPHQVRTAVVPVLTKALEESPSEQERQAAARALGQLGPAARDAVPALVARLRSAPTPQEGQVLAHALVQIGPAARGAVENLERMADKDKPVLEACQRLQGREGRIGVNDGGECFSVRTLRKSARAIADLANRAQVELMVETAPDLRPDAVQQARGRLRDMGPRGVCVLIGKVGKDGPDVRVWATEGLRRDGLPTDKLAQAVADHCRRKDYDGALDAAVRFVAERAKK